MFVRMIPLVGLLVMGVGVGISAGQEKEKHAKEPETHAKADDAAGKDHAAGAADAHEDPYDNSHKNATKSVTDPTAIKADSAIFTFFVFLLILAVLTKFAWKPIAHGLDLREKGIAEKIEHARLAAEQASTQLAQYEAKLAAATAEAQQIIAKARQDADVAGQRLIADAQATASKERERAVADIGVAKNQALREIAEKSVDTAIGLARNIIRREVRPGDHEQLIHEALKQFPAKAI